MSIFSRRAPNGMRPAAATEPVGFVSEANSMLTDLSNGYPPRPTLKHLLALQYRINQSRVDNARLCTVKERHLLKTANGNPAYLYIVYDDVRGSTRRHQVSISSQDGRKPEESLYGVVMCSCEDWTFRSEYALMLANWTFIYRSNGEPADVKNPNNEWWLCKHVIAALAHMYRVQP